MKKTLSMLNNIIFDKFSIIIFGAAALFISLFAEFEIVEPLTILFVIYASTKYRKRGIIYSSIFGIFVLGVQDLYTLEINFFEFFIEALIIIIAAAYIFHSKSSIEKTNKELQERVKELSSLYNISRISEQYHVDLESLLSEVVSEIPAGYQYPDDICALIEFEGQKYRSDDFKKSEWLQKSDIIINEQKRGIIRVYYKSKHPQEFNNSPFLKEEYDLIDSTAERISSTIKIIEQQKDLREQRKFLSITLNSIGDGVIVTDKNGKVIRLNQEAQKLTKWSSEEAKGKDVNDIFNIVNANTRKTVDNPVDKVLAEGEIVGLANHTKLIAKDKTEYHIADSASPIKDEEGNIYGVVLVFRNVTQKYKMRNEIKNKAELLANAVEEAPFPIMLHNDQGEVLNINEVWEEISGYSKEEIPTIDAWVERAYDENRESVKEYIKDLNQIKNRKDDGEFIIKTKDNDYRTWDFKSAKIGSDKDGNDMLISMAIDVTERNRMEKRIRVLNRIYKTLSSINQIIARENSVTTLIDESTKTAVEVGGYDTAWIASINKGKNNMNIESVSGKNCSYLSSKESINLDLNSADLNIYEKTVKFNEKFIINKDSKSELKGDKCGSIGVFPIRVFGELWGLAVFCSKQTNLFTDKEVKLLDELSTDISLGIEKIITNEKRLKSEREYRQLFEKSPVGIFKTTSRGSVKLINPSMAEMLGFASVEETYRHYNDLGEDLYVNAEKRREFIQELEKYGEVRNFIYQAYDKDKKIKWLEMNARISSERTPGDFFIEGFALDITERKKHEDKVTYMSFHDRLTGLYNRAYIEDMIKRIDTERKLPITMIMADLNNLKFINDSYGHSKGDELIKQAGNLIQESCRQEDVVARWGGDEFVILLPNTAQKESKKIIERINEKEITLDAEIPISIALGAATKTKRNEDISKVLNKAEDRMYINKFANRESGRSIVLSSFLNTLKEKSHETESHVNRMSEMAKKFGANLNLSHENIDKLSMLSLLHDIGKISVPESILNKTGKLTDEEWEVIKSHPEAGYRILESIPRFSNIAEAVLHHHERWDGTGYPDGLKEQDIPMLSRILSIVDSYDVMVSGRPYKRAMSLEEVINELKSCSGTQFDPELVDVFLGILQDE